MAADTRDERRGRGAGRKPVIGLLGGIGSGKSLVARQLASLGCGVIDADALAKAALAEPAVRDRLVAWWGPSVVAADGSVDRKAVARIVFNRPEELRKLESVLHPRVNAGRAALRERYRRDPTVPAIVEDTPLLLEAGLDRECDVLVFVAASREARLKRVAARGWSDDELARREKNQTGLDIKARRADHVVRNDAGEAELMAQVRDVLSQILHKAA